MRDEAFTRETERRSGGSAAPNRRWAIFWNLGGVIVPWVVLLYAWWIGLHWTVIGLGVVDAAAFLIAGGAVWEKVRRGDI